jgi:hypothetical protein
VAQETPKLTSANVSDRIPAPGLICEMSLETRYVPGDNHYKTSDVRDSCENCERLPIASGRGPYAHTDSSVDMRRILHLSRHQAIEPVNGLFKNVFEWDGQVPVKGSKRTPLIVLGPVLVHPLALILSVRAP